MAKLDMPAVPVVAEHNTPIEMRDGTRLRADVYRAAEGGPSPVLLIRSPYGEQMLRAGAPVIPAIDAGFAVVMQHCRGTGASDGEFVPFETEAADGVDTIEWCARQPWCDGSVAMYGPSYLGMVQLAAATQAPPALKALVPIVTPADYHWGLAYRQGAFQLGQALGWHMLKSGQTLAYRAAAGQDISAEMSALLRLMADPAAGYAHLPVRDAPAVSRILPSWRDWLAHEERDGYWARLSYRDARDRVTTPALHVGGWFDLFLGGTLDNFTTLSRGAATEHARRGQRLIVGPWTHVDRTGAAGELHFGVLASEQAIQLIGVNLYGVIHGVQTFLPILEANADGGHIVNTASMAGLVGPQRLGAYSVTKFGVVALTEVLAAELAQAGSKVGATVLCPGTVRTNIRTSSRNRPEHLAGGRLADVDISRGENPAYRWISPDEAGAVVVRAIQRGDLYALTHPEWYPMVERRHQTIAAAFRQAEAQPQ